MEFIKIEATDAAEIKAGKEQLNIAFNALDTKTKNGLDEAQKALNNELKEVREKSESLEKTLGELKANAEAAGKDATTQIEELKTALTEMSRAKATEAENRKKGFSDKIAEGIQENKERVSAFLKNKNAGMQMEIKTPGNMGVATNAVAPQFSPIVGPGHEWVHARQLIPVSPTNSNLIRYVQFTKKDGSVGTVLINSLKNQIDYNENVVDAAVIKLAGWINVADEFLEDIDGATSFLSAELPMALYDAEDAQIFKGVNGTGNISGLFTNATAITVPAAYTNDIDKLAYAATYVRRQHRVATGAWVSPEDYLNILVNKASGSGQYTYPVRFNATNNQLTIGDVPIMQHTVFNPGEGFVGDFARGCRIFQKADATLRFSTENVDNFVKNVTTVLVEERIALANYFPESFAKLNLNATWS